MSHCRKCQNQTVIERLEQTVRQLPQELQVSLVFDQRELAFSERQCNRRELLTLFCSAGKTRTPNPVDQLHFSKPPEDYVTNRLSTSRSLLLQSIERYPEQAAIIDESFWPKVSFDASCNYCHSCIAICPTGALLEPARSGALPSFNSRNCVDCKLCEEFCRRSAIQIETS